MSASESSTCTAVSFDLLAISIVSIAIVGISSAPVLVAPFVRVSLGIVFVLFAPGYALVSVLLPERTAIESGQARQITIAERLVMSIGLSAIIVPLVGYALHYATLRIDGAAMVSFVGAITVALAVLAWGRRRLASDPFGIDPFGAMDRTKVFLVVPRQRRETALNAAIVIGIVVAAATIGVTAATNENGERYTEFYLLSGGAETEGAVADGYPVEVTSGDSAAFVVGIANHERESITYTVVVQLQRIDTAADDRAITERVVLDTFEVSVDSGDSVEREHVIEPTLEGEDLRVTYLLYAETPPEDPTAENAYRSTHAWIDVTASVTAS
jgi:uncharacterized membrane protein